MTLLAGFDAGQTRTRCRISQWQNGTLQVLGEGAGPGVSHLSAPGGEARFQRALLESAAAALTHHPDVVIDFAAVGASGIEHGTALQQRAERLLSDALKLDRRAVLTTGDERTALRGAISEGAGIILISGTGMICLGKNGKGQEHRCGGWGWLLDGAGSAFDLGHQGLQLSLLMADGRLPDHPMRRKLWDVLGCRSNADVKARVVQPDFGPAEFAALAPIVVASAVEGCGGAEAVLQRSAAALAKAVTAVSHQLCLTAPLLICQGGAVTHLEEFRDAVKRAIHREVPDLHWGIAEGDACDGALLMAEDRMLRQR